MGFLGHNFLLDNSPTAQDLYQGGQLGEEVEDVAA